MQVGRSPDVGALAQDGWDAIKERRYGDAKDAFTEAAKLEPNEPSLLLGGGFAAFMLGETNNAREWLERALTLSPRLTEASLLLGELQYRQGQVADAINTYERALPYAARQEDLQAKLDEWRRESRLHDRFYQAQGAHFRVLFEGPADEALARRAVEMLEDAYWRVGSALTTYPSGTVTVVLYTLEQFHDITRSPAWAGGVYDGRIKVPMRGALEQPADLERVLAHEFVHAVVASIAGRTVPTWINEGLATLLEPGGRDWTNECLAKTDIRLPHKRLHQGFSALAADDALLAYAQSAAAVQKMIDLRGMPAVVLLLRDLARGAAFENAFQQTIAMRYEDFQALLH
jgi:tetratricopeptide (TPR) repeat protein